MNKAPQPPGGSVRRGRLILRHRDHGLLPILGKVESLRVNQSFVIRDQDQAGEVCAGCGRVIPSIEAIHSVCGCCGLPLCSGPNCGEVHCCEETCGQAVCGRCRRRIGETEDGHPEFLCLPHYEEHSRQVAIITAVVLGALAILGTVLFFIFR